MLASAAPPPEVPALILSAGGGPPARAGARPGWCLSGETGGRGNRSARPMRRCLLTALLSILPVQVAVHDPDDLWAGGAYDAADYDGLVSRLAAAGRFTTSPSGHDAARPRRTVWTPDHASRTLAGLPDSPVGPLLGAPAAAALMRADPSRLRHGLVRDHEALATCNSSPMRGPPPGMTLPSLGLLPQRPRSPRQLAHTLLSRFQPGWLSLGDR